MCISPLITPEGLSLQCRKCWQCAENVVNDAVGRCIAESKTAAHTSIVNLTYGRDDDDESDHVRAALLTYSDVQKYLKRLKNNGFPCRYFIVGEYGSKNGRAHWHAIMFWKDKVPPHVKSRRVVQAHWDWGFSWFDPCNPNSVRYVCKYIQKDFGDESKQIHKGQSKMPPLGSEYFKKVAEQFVAAGLAPQDLFYSYEDCRNDNDEIIQFMLQGKSREIFLEHFVDQWLLNKKGELPPSELVSDYLDSEYVRKFGSVRDELEFEDMKKRLEKSCQDEEKKQTARAEWLWRKQQEISPWVNEGWISLKALHPELFGVGKPLGK